MEKRLIPFLSGISITMIGLVYGLSNQDQYFSNGLSAILRGTAEWVLIFSILPNLLPSIPIIIGGIIITIIGIIYFLKKKN